MNTSKFKTVPFGQTFVICMLLLHVIVLCSGFPGNTNMRQNTNRNDLFTEPEVFITLSAVAGYVEADNSYEDTMLELNWARFSPENEDWIGLFNYDVEMADPDTNHTELALHSVSATQNSTGIGYFKTSTRFGRPPINASSTNGDNCLGFWIAYMEIVDSEPVPILSNCFRKYPTWMADLKNVIGDTPLHSLMIPGTHDAGAIREYDGSGSENLILRYSVTQEEQLYRQFVHGVRYVDMRVAFYGDTAEKFWINHGVVRYAPLITLFNAVNRFVAETNEIIFMDFHGFPVGMDTVPRHEELVKFVQAEVGDLLVHKSMVSTDMTPNQLWDLKRNVILTYQRNDIGSQHDFLWPYLIHGWGDVNEVQPLEDYFDKVAIPQYGCTGIFWSAMAEITPRTSDIINYPLRGLRGFAQMVNLPLTYWWQRPEWYSKSMIVSTDFFLGNNIIEMAVKVNTNKAVCPFAVSTNPPNPTTTENITKESTTEIVTKKSTTEEAKKSTTENETKSTTGANSAKVTQVQLSFVTLMYLLNVALN